jgi:hypothetical protein
VTGGTRRDDGDLPVFDALEPGDFTGVGPGRPARRGGLGPARGAGIAAGALVLLVGAIAVGGLSLAPEPTASGDGTALPSGATTEGGPCTRPREGQFPALTLAVRGTTDEVGELFVSGYGFGRQTQAPGWPVAGWPMPPTSRALVARPTDALALSASRDACFRHASVEYTATRKLPATNPIKWFQDSLVPSARTLILGGLPDGDWVVRVTAHFDSFETEPVGELVTVTYFRILSGAGPFVTEPTLSPDPTPLISPTVPCATLAPTPDIGVSLVVGSSAPVPGGANDGADPPEVHARLGDPIRVIVDGDVCAVRWNIGLVNDETGEEISVDRFDRPNDDPGYAAQNRWDISTYGQQTLTADLHFPGGINIVRSWRVIIDPFVVPALFLVGPNGARFEATAGCGLYVHLSNGYEAGDDCGSIGYAPGPEALMVRAYRAIHLDLAGWTIVGWGADCGRVTGVDDMQFEAPDGCGLGGGYSESGVALEDPPAFLLPPRDTVVRIYIAAIDDAGDQYNVSYFAHVIAR